jgi:hypothetical protein
VHIDWAMTWRETVTTGPLSVRRVLLETFGGDVRPVLVQLRTEIGVDSDPVEAFRRGGYAAPDMLLALSESGIRNYSIFRNDNQATSSPTIWSGRPSSWRRMRSVPAGRTPWLDY